MLAKIGLMKQTFLSHSVTLLRASQLVAIQLLSTVCLAAVSVIPGTAADAPKAKPLPVVSFRLGGEGLEAARNLLIGQSTQLKPGPEFVKFSVSFATPSNIKAVSIESCGGEFADGIDFFFYPGQRRVFVEGGRTFALARVPDDQPVSTLAVVFRHQTPSCLQGFRLFDRPGRALLLTAPELSPGKTEGDEQRKLFDQRFLIPAEFSSGLAKDFSFESSQDFDRVQVWVGDQLGEANFRETPKLLRFSISADGGKPQSIQAKEKLGMQEIMLKKPLAGKKIRFTPASSGALSELRFGSGSGSTARTFLPMEDGALESKVAKTFSDNQLKELLDHELVTREESDNWHFRFRSDSTFFVYGNNDEQLGVAGHLNGLGRFEVLGAQPKKIKIRLQGYKLEAAFLWDGSVCGPGCGETLPQKIKPIDETIVLERLPNGVFMVRNRNTQAKRTLLFSDLKSKVSSLSE